MFRNRMLGGVSAFICFAPDGPAGGGSGSGDQKPGAGGAAPVGQSGQGGGGPAGDGAAPGAGAGAGGNAGGGAADTLAAGGADPAKVAAASASGVTGKFPDNWREALAGDDKGLLKDLQKYADPGKLYQSLRDLQGKISKGELKAAVQPLPENATEEQKAEWRKAQGLPDKASGYVEKLVLPDGVVIGDSDKDLVGWFAENLAHKRGWSQDQFNQAVSAFYEAQTMVEGQRAEADGLGKQVATEALMKEWGPGSFKTNMRAVGTFIDSMPKGFADLLLTARTQDGRIVGDTPEFNQYAAQLSRDLYPAATIIPNGGGNSIQAVSDELKSIEAVMSKAVAGDRDARKQYYGEPGRPGLEARYRELLDAQEKMRQRAGSGA